jgi:hypothetical protein
VFDFCVKLVVLLRDDTDSLLVVAPDRGCTVESKVVLAKKRIHSSICEAARERESSSDSVVDFVTVRCTVDFQSIMSPLQI